jgi:hypothetical protein
VGDLKTLQAVAAFCLTADYIKDLVDKLCALGVMALSPVVTGSRLSENKVVGTEKLAERSGTDSVHSTRLQIDKNSTRDIFVARPLGIDSELKHCRLFLAEISYLVEVNVHPLQLEVASTVVAVSPISSPST